jgi:two-component system, OmpR family, phosphate regulon sensor histidine kinase PhoR
MTVGKTPTRFISLRWRFLLPLFLVLMVATMIGAYWLGNNLNVNMDDAQVRLLLQNSRAVATRTAALYEQNRLEAQRIAYTSGVREAIQQRVPTDLQTTLESSARLANLDNVIVTDAAGVEVLGLMRVEKAGGGVDYAVSTGTNLGDEAIIRAVQNEGYVGATELARTQEGLILYTAVPVSDARSLVGIVLIGQRLGNALEALRSGGTDDVALYGPDSTPLQTTLKTDAALASSLALPAGLFNQTLTDSHQVRVQTFKLGAQPYQAAYFPFQFGPQVLGVVGVFSPDNSLFLTGMGQQLIGLTLSAVVAAVVIGLFMVVNTVMIARLNRIKAVASALSSGSSTARTGMKSSDEVSAVGQALDQYADYVQERQDNLRASLRRQRRETEYLMSVLESMADGIVVQDMDGRVVVMNERAKALLGKSLPLRNFSIYESDDSSPAGGVLGEILTTTVTDKLGAALAPGLYSMGDPKRVELGRKMLTAQAAAVTNISHERVGTVIVLRDITQDVWRERAQESLFSRVERDVQKPLADMARTGQQPISAVTRELSRHAVALQKLVVEMREITMPDAPGVREGQRPLLLETLVWAIANEWRQVAAAANLVLDVLIERKGLYVLGDERRLRWAIGNLVDNAVKYTQPGGKLILEIRGEDKGQAHLRIRDNGVGIAAEELPNIFTRFFRGTPVTKEGYMIRVPGMGQGLSTAKQIIEAHGGMIQIKSKVGVGTAVYFTLPLTAPVGLELSRFPVDVDMEGETMPLREDEL